MNKKTLLSMLLIMSLVGCGKEEPTPHPTQEPTAQPTVEPTVAPTAEPTVEPTTQPSEPEPTLVPSEPEPTVLPTDEPFETKYTNVFVVGDSTMCTFNDETYYYPRYGYATQLQNYLIDNANIVNLALSGRSSKSFTSEENYQTLLASLKEGDYLIIGFGHNDEKSDDAVRFTDASKPITDSTSFKYSLYENYIKVALEKKATPILCTPIVRANSKNDYTGSHAHITENGDYAKAIVELGQEKGVEVIDLTEITKNRYTELGYNEAIYYHAMTTGQYDTDGVTVIPNTTSVDTTHLNIYGAKYVAYKLAES